MPPADAGHGARPGDALTEVIRSQLEAGGFAADPQVQALLRAVFARHGASMAAVLLYGSYLRGKRDTLLDFYVLLDDLGTLPGRWQAWGNRLLPPNVYHVAADHAGHLVRAKYATLSVAQFRGGMARFHSYFWSRFTQPCALVYARDGDAHGAVEGALADAVHTFVKRSAATLTGRFAAAELWQAGFARTYTCELRAERGDGITALYQHNAGHFDRLLRAYAARAGAAVQHLGEDAFRSLEKGRAGALAGWQVRRVQGKVLSVLRLVKAAGTFDDPLDYLLWKIERHSGVYLPPTERQRRHPLIFAWPLLWRLYRRGAFR